MSQARHPRADDPPIIPPDGPETKTSSVEPAVPITEVDAAPLRPTVDANPDRPGPVIAETMVSPSPGVDKTLTVGSAAFAVSLKRAN